MSVRTSATYLLPKKVGTTYLPLPTCRLQLQLLTGNCEINILKEDSQYLTSTTESFQLVHILPMTHTVLARDLALQLAHVQEVSGQESHMFMAP